MSAPREGDRVRLTYGDGSTVEGTWRAVLERDDGTLHTHTRGQVRRDVVVQASLYASGNYWPSTPGPEHDTADDGAPAGWDAGCTCGWRGLSEDVEAHAEVCPLPDAWQVADDAENAPTVQVHVDRDGAVRAVCSCGDLDETGPTRRVLQRMGAHVGLHASAAVALVPWSEVRHRRAMLDLGPGRN